MNGKQHFKVGIGAGIGTAICLAVNEPYGIEPAIGAVVGGVAAMFASKLPDIDHNSTKIGRVRKKVTGTSSALVTLLLFALILGSLFMAITGRTEVAGHTFDKVLLFKIAVGAAVVLFLRKCIKESSTVKWMTAHRGFMHTLIIPILLGVGAWYIPSVFLSRVLIGTTVGYLCHIDADMYTVDGSPIGFPITQKSFRRHKTYKSEDKALDRVASRLRNRYIILGIIAAILLKL